MRISVLLLLLFTAPSHAGAPLRIAVAANFRATLEVINAEYAQTTEQRFTVSSASTGVLTTQILHGAPFDLFFAADHDAPQALITARKSLSNTPSQCYAVGRLALAGDDLPALASAAKSVAIANPQTAPYGRSALAVLSRPAYQQGQARKLVRGNNAVQAYQFYVSGAVDLALIPQAIAPPEAVSIPASWHPPIEQYLIALKRSEALERYLNWLRSDRVRALIKRAGYDPCP